MKYRALMISVLSVVALVTLSILTSGAARPPAVQVPVIPISAEELASCPHAPGYLPHPDRPAGQADGANPVQNVVILMQENHSFDQYLGQLNLPKYYGDAVDGVNREAAQPDKDDRLVKAYAETNLCVADVPHYWNAQHDAWNEGKNDGFVRQSGARVIGYYSDTDIPYYYALANQFATADRYFCSVLGPTFPNRYYLLAGTSFGHVDNEMPPENTSEYSQPNVFDLLSRHGVSWKYYSDGPGYVKLFGGTYARERARIVPLAQYQEDLRNGTLPQISFVESNWEADEDEHPDENIQIGQAWVAERVNALIQSPYWEKSALFLTYDENGGFYDHVAPPTACRPDVIPPKLDSGSYNSYPATFNRYGFRVPFFAVSPYAKRHYVSHVVYDHTSVLRYLEEKFNLPALTRRDANAAGLGDLFDYAHPDFTRPALPDSRLDPSRACVSPKRASKKKPHHTTGK